MISLQGLTNDLKDAIKIGGEKVIERWSDNAVMVRQGDVFGIRYMRKTNIGSMTDTYEFCASQNEAHKLANERGLIPRKVAA